MIDDIINYVDEEDQEEIIVFVDQEKTYDKVEWGWVNHDLEGFNFGSKFCGRIQMLFKNAQTCIKTNGFISKLFSLSPSASQGKTCVSSASIHIFDSRTFSLPGIVIPLISSVPLIAQAIGSV
jgi:hypothetical protein